MKMPNIIRLVSVLVLGLCAFCAATEPSRVWTSSDGRQLTGSFVKADTEFVTVMRGNFTNTSIPLAKLSDDDRKFVTAKAAEKKAAEKAAADEIEALKKPLGSITYKLSGGSEGWPEDRRKRIVDAMDQGIEFYNKHANFKKELTANNSPGTPTADSNITGWINWGGAISRRVALHEIAHTLGIGTAENWQKNIKDGLWIGTNALDQLHEFDGEKAVLHADRQHFWPYGLNQDNESSPVNDIRHIKMVEAIRKDMGIK